MFSSYSIKKFKFYFSDHRTVILSTSDIRPWEGSSLISSSQLWMQHRTVFTDKGLPDPMHCFPRDILAWFFYTGFIYFFKLILYSTKNPTCRKIFSCFWAFCPQSLSWSDKYLLTFTSKNWNQSCSWPAAFSKKAIKPNKRYLHKLAFLLHCPHIHQKPMSFKLHKIQSLLSAINSFQGTLSFPGFCVNVSDSAKYNVNYDNSLLSVPPTLLLAEVSCSAARGILTQT